MSELSEMAGNDEPIACIIPAPADNQDRTPRVQLLAEPLGHPSPGVFHQRQAGDPKAFDRDLIDST